LETNHICYECLKECYKCGQKDYKLYQLKCQKQVLGC
jgi:hypothetical protein